MQEPDSGRLKFVLNTWTICNLPSISRFPDGMSAHEKVSLIRKAGYTGLQMGPDDPLLEASQDLGMSLSATGKVLSAAHVNAICKLHRAKGFALTTLHVGTGFETADEGMRLIDAVLETSTRYGYPMYVETHRATITQDPRRTLDLVSAFPDLRLSADLSHWYSGCELPNGNFRAKLKALRPIFERTRYIQGRIADSGCIQVPVGRASDTNRRHFQQMWSRCMLGFLENTSRKESLFFAPTLLPKTLVRNGCLVEINYARMKKAPGGLVEETDRWCQSRLLCALARKAFKTAQSLYLVRRQASSLEALRMSPDDNTLRQSRAFRTTA